MENTTNWEKTSDGYKVVGLSTGGVSMTNNNWEELREEYRDWAMKYASSYNSLIADWWLEKFAKELTKKDQEHKAELEMIKGEIESKKDMYRNEFTKHEWCEVGNDYNKGIKDTISILDSHINKLSTE